MIKYNNSEFSAGYAGLFYTDKEWMHPKTTIETYEIILVTNGTVYIEEAGTQYTLKRNDLLLLNAGEKHGGFKMSTGVTSFYWIHFHASDLSVLMPIKKHIENYSSPHLFKEYIHIHHLYNYPTECLDVALLNLIARISAYKKFIPQSKIVNDVYEYIKNNSSPALTAQKIADHFGYRKEHLTRIMQNQYGIGIKKLNNDFLITKINNMLANTDFSLKEIAGLSGFDDVNIFLKFYKYHTGITPSGYKNMYGYTYMNNN